MTQLALGVAPPTGTATFSPCRRYRYTLTRGIGEPFPGQATRTALWCMLNPSVADDVRPDPTIKRVIGFSRAHGFDRLVVVNLFGIVDDDPAILRNHPDPVGPENDDAIRAAIDPAGRATIAAWGVPGNRYRERVDAVTAILGDRLQCLGRNKGGSPGHPLYLSKNRPLIPWPEPGLDVRGRVLQEPR